MDDQRLDAAVESSMAADVDALMAESAPERDCEPVHTEQPADATLLAIGLADAYRNHGDFAGLISASLSFGKMRIFVTHDYFKKHYANFAGIKSEPIPAHGAIEQSVEVEGADIYCWAEAKYELVAV